MASSRPSRAKVRRSLHTQMRTCASAVEGGMSSQIASTSRDTGTTWLAWSSSMVSRICWRAPTTVRDPPGCSTSSGPSTRN